MNGEGLKTLSLFPPEKYMAADITLSLDEDALLDDMIRLEGEGLKKAGRDDFQINDDYAEFVLWVHRDTGLVILIEVDRFRAITESAIQELKERPLPWSFSLLQFGIKEKPLEDLLLAVWEKYKGMKMEWE
jgi:hypothetical protein